MGKKSHATRKGSKKISNTEIKSTFSSKNRKQLDCLVDELLKQVFVQIPNADKLWEVYQDVSKIISLINSLENSSENPLPENRKAATEIFIHWIKENEVNCDDIEICDFPNLDFGLKAKRSFSRGSLVVNVPRKLMLTEECAKTSILGNLVARDPILTYMPNVTLAMYLLLKKFSSNSFWKPYIDVLPTSYNTVLYFSLSDMQELKGSPVWPRALKLQLDIARQFAYFYKLLQTSDEPAALQMKDNFSYSEYRWAVSTVMTRQNMVPSASSSSPSSPAPLTPALIPLWDMCNHEQGEITTNFDPEKDQAECFALRDFQKGEQIFIFYGVRTNAFFFLHNGFVHPENSGDSLEVTLGVSSQDPLRPLKEALLAALPAPPETGLRHSLHGPPLPVLSPALLAFARIFVMDKEELTSRLEGDRHAELMEPEGAPALRERAFSFLHTRCRLLLATYTRDSPPNLGQPGDPSHRGLIKQLKECEMKILQRAIDFTKPTL